MSVTLVHRNLESWYLPLPCLNYLRFFFAVLLQIMVLGLVNNYVVWIHLKPPFLQLILCWITNLLPQVQDFGRLLISQPYWSLIESQNCCSDNLNPNSVIGSTVNQFETPVWVDIATRRFSLSFISAVNLSMTFLKYSTIDFFISILGVSLDYLRLYRIVEFVV